LSKSKENPEKLENLIYELIKTEFKTKDCVLKFISISKNNGDTNGNLFFPKISFGKYKCFVITTISPAFNCCEPFIFAAFSKTNLCLIIWRTKNKLHTGNNRKIKKSSRNQIEFRDCQILLPE
jgi:hypothetical protein